MRRALIIILTVTAFAVPAAVLYLTRDAGNAVPLGAPTPVQVARATTLLRSCLPVARPDGENPCLETQLTAAALHEGPRAAIAAVVSLSSEDPNIGFACHRPGHAMGRTVFNTVRSLDEAVQAADFHCEGAYIHGVFDAWAVQRPPVAAFIGAARSCNTLAMENQGHCFDGLGHVLWRTHPDVQTMSDVCAAATSGRGRSACLGGVMMQRYVPLIGDRTEDIHDAPAGLRSLCRSLVEWEPLVGPDVGVLGSITNPDIAASCLMASTYTLGVRYMSPVLHTSAMDDANISDTLDETIRQYLSGCSSVVDVTSDAAHDADLQCRAAVGYLVYRGDPTSKKPLAHRVCDTYFKDEEPARAVCNYRIDDQDR